MYSSHNRRVIIIGCDGRKNCLPVKQKKGCFSTQLPSIIPRGLLLTSSTAQSPSPLSSASYFLQGVNEGSLPSDHTQDIPVSPIQPQPFFTILCSCSFSSWFRTLARSVCSSLQYARAANQSTEPFPKTNRLEISDVDPANDISCLINIQLVDRGYQSINDGYVK